MKFRVLALLMVAFVFGLYGCGATTATAPVAEKTAAAAAPAKPVIDQVKEAGFAIVDYDYVLGKVGNGIRKTKDVVIVDARPEKAFGAAHIPGAINIFDVKFDKYVGQLDEMKVAKETEIITYCGGFACEKSLIVAKRLKEMGYTNVKIYLAGNPEWDKKFAYPEIDLATAKAKFDKKEAILVDARPGRLAKTETILGSINIHDAEYEKLKATLTDKEAAYVIFCQGYACEKSHNLAKAMKADGFTKVSVYAGGVPEWKAAGYPVAPLGETVAAAPAAAATTAAAPAAAGAVKAGKDEGTVDKEWFKANLASLPANVAVVDVRSAGEYAAGNAKGSINVHVDQIYKKDGCAAVTAQLPKDKTLIFMCGSGARASEMFFNLKDECKVNVANMFYLNSAVNYSSGAPVIQ